MTEPEQEPPKPDVTNILTALNKRASDKGWRFELGNQETPENPAAIVIILSIDNDNKLSIDCDRFTEGITGVMTSKKNLVNSENRIYIKGEEDRLVPVIGKKRITQYRSDSVSNFVNCVDNKDPSSECKLPEVIKERIWECIESKREPIDKNTMSQLEKYYRPQKEIEKLVPEEKEPPICDFFKEVGPNKTQDVCGDKMIDYLKEKLADMREDINKISKTGKQKETAEFEKSVEMELAGNEMWEIIKSAIDQPANSFDPNGFIKANINMPTTQANQDVEYKEQEEDLPIAE